MIRTYAVVPLMMLACAATSRAQDVAQPPATAPAGAWVGLSYHGDQNSDEAYRWNTQTGAWGAQLVDHGVVVYAEYRNPVTGENAEYNAASRDGTKEQTNPGAIMIAEQFPPDADNLRAAAAVPLTFPELLAVAKADLGDGGVRVTQDTDRGMTRVTLEKGDAPAPRTKSANEEGYERQRRHFSLNVPMTLWIDPKTQLVQETKSGTTTGTFTYNAPPVASIYDMGVRRDAKVMDGRMSKETLAVFDRVVARMHKPLPDGVVAVVEATETKDKPTRTTMEVFGVAGKVWSKRLYRVNVAGDDRALKLPENWATTDAEAFFFNLASSLPDQVTRSDGTHGYFARIDPVTGRESHPSDIFGGDAPKTLPGPEKLPAYDSDVTQVGPTTYLYPDEIVDARYEAGFKVETVTDADHPGLVALSVRAFEGTPDQLAWQADYWIDPAHDDRPVTYTKNTFNAKAAVPRAIIKEVTTFGGYTTAPAPDGRSYPTTRTRTSQAFDNDGKPTWTTRVATTFHLFPGKKLPEIPQPPEGLP